MLFINSILKGFPKEIVKKGVYYSFFRPLLDNCSVKLEYMYDLQAVRDEASTKNC